MLRALLFDLDGVLIDSVDLHWEAYVRAMEEFGLEPDRKLVRNLMGEKSEVIIARASNRELDPKELAAVNKRKQEVYRQLFQERKPIRPGARELLAWARDSGLLLALSTGTKRKNAEMFLEVLGFNPFHAIITADDVTKAKPDPEIWLRSLEALNVKSEEALAIEDSILGVRSAKAANLAVIALTVTFPEEELKKEGADWLAKDLWEVKSLVERLLTNPDF